MATKAKNAPNANGATQAGLAHSPNIAEIAQLRRRTATGTNMFHTLMQWIKPGRNALRQVAMIQRITARPWSGCATGMGGSVNFADAKEKMSSIIKKVKQRVRFITVRRHRL